MPEPLIESNKQRLGNEVEPQIEELIQRADRAIGVLERKEVGLKRKVRPPSPFDLPEENARSRRRRMRRAPESDSSGKALAFETSELCRPAEGQLADGACTLSCAPQLANADLAPPPAAASRPAAAAKPTTTAADQRRLAMVRGRKEKLRLELAALEGAGGGGKPF